MICTSFMEHRTFGRTGLSVSVLGFGAAPIGYLGTAQTGIEATVNLLLDAGLNFIDTAASYPGSEEALGKAVGHRRSQFVLVSKCGQSFDDLPGPAWSAEVITATIDRSLRRLRTDHLDVMLLHSCDLEVLKRGEAVGALAKAREAGKIKFAGYSGDNEAAVYAAKLPDIAVIETSVNICDQANLGTVIPVAREQNVGVIAKRPIANTAWKPAQEMKGIYQDYAKPYRERFAAMEVNPRDIGFSGDADWPEIALRFTLSHPGVHVAIIGTTNPVNAQRNIAAAAKGPLPKEARERIQSAFRRAHETAGEPWPGLT
jgi:aryl-alcohol dehydrogenase-like predicted oxidoreductase